ncbi:energy transducer TonB [Pelodictyon luteolum]|uniref:Outer membrane transport energization protein TonB n=1 Tax=Chlorobium luteolum (strain DSM 273 / BCRC 81028 / 2530) TaxID=319225 RepID=Q3B2J2_CHLL3|nr:energy transducer TonB [Pelodictyon luteolum]ABB24439.1 outer membrane transport energization protein TonB [Pelodictyon luteolum DSM 273]
MQSNLKKIHSEIDAETKASRWSFSEEFLDTDRLRGIWYGNLSLRRQAHIFLSHGVIAAVMLLFLFWVAAANWGRIMSLFGGSADSGRMLQCYEVVTSVTQLPPPPPLAAPPPAPAVPSVPAAVAPNVGKIKKVKENEVPAEQTIATQKELRQAIQTERVDGSGEGGPVFIPCEKMPGFLDQRKPHYPEMARIAGIEGKVFVSVLIGEDGRPMRAVVMKRIPADCTVFDDVAVRSVMESKYFPGIQNGRAIKVWFTVPIRFQIN